MMTATDWKMDSSIIDLMFLDLKDIIEHDDACLDKKNPCTLWDYYQTVLGLAIRIRTAIYKEDMLVVDANDLETTRKEHVYQNEVLSIVNRLLAAEILPNTKIRIRRENGSYYVVVSEGPMGQLDFWPDLKK